jgi:hypothetical protein
MTALASATKATYMYSAYFSDSDPALFPPAEPKLEHDKAKLKLSA